MERTRFLTSDFVKVMNADMLERYTFSDEYVYPIIIRPTITAYDKNIELYRGRLVSVASTFVGGRVVV